MRHGNEIKMGIDKELEKQVYKYRDREAPAEIWINKKMGTGFRIEGFWLDGVKNEH